MLMLSERNGLGAEDWRLTDALSDECYDRHVSNSELRALADTSSVTVKYQLSRGA